MQRRDIRIIGSHMYVQRDFAQALRLLSEKKICTDRSISRQYPFSRIADAFDDTAKNPGQILKTMIYFDGPISGAGEFEKGRVYRWTGKVFPEKPVAS